VLLILKDLAYIYICILMENSNRKCGRCKTILNLTYYRKENHNCNICLAKDKDRYVNNRDVMVQRSRDYRLNNLEK
jgi:tryptophanase